MDKIFVIHLDDYIRHIEDKLTLHAMLRQLEAAVSKLPVCESTKEVHRLMQNYAPAFKEMWEGWNIPIRYLVSGELDDLSDLMAEELAEPEDMGYFSEDSDIYAGEDFIPDAEDYEMFAALVDLVKKYHDNLVALMDLAEKQRRRCDQ